jgi:hypothetical protein
MIVITAARGGMFRETVAMSKDYAEARHAPRLGGGRWLLMAVREHLGGTPVMVVWTTRYIDAAVAQLRAEGHEIAGEDIARLSPLKHRNLNVLGRYSFIPSTPASGALRPLRDPDAAELDDDEDGQEE